MESEDPPVASPSTLWGCMETENEANHYMCLLCLSSHGLQRFGFMSCSIVGIVRCDSVRTHMPMKRTVWYP